MDSTSFLVLAAVVNRVIEAIKPGLKNTSDKLKWSEDAYVALVRTVSVLLGVVLAFVAGQVNLVPATLPIPPVVGVIGTGVVIGLGADVVNLAIDFFYGWVRPQPKEEPVVG